MPDAEKDAGRSDSYTVASADRCTVHPQHVMVNRGRVEAVFADVYECACGKWAIANTDESRARRAGVVTPYVAGDA